MNKWIDRPPYLLIPFNLGILVNFQEILELKILVDNENYNNHKLKSPNVKFTIKQNLRFKMNLEKLVRIVQVVNNKFKIKIICNKFIKI